MYNYHSSPFYDLPSNGAYTNLTLQSVHLSPEELAAIDHGLMSVYGTTAKPIEKENLIFNTPAPASHNANRTNTNNNYGYNTPTPTPMIFNDGKPLFQNKNYNDTYNTPQTTQNTQNHTPFTPIFNNTSPIDEKLVKTYEDRIEGILKQEREKYEVMESNYRQQLEQLKKNEFGYSEKLKLEQIIQDLRRQIDNLERQLSEARRNGSSNSSNDTEKIEALKLHYDRKIATLVGQFEQEKASALEIMKTRAKAEINLIIPRLKAQLQTNLERSQSEIVNKIKAQAQNYIQKMKQDFQMERQVLIEHLRRKHFEELKQVKNQLQMKFEMKLSEERRKLQQQQSTPYRSSSIYTGNFGSNTGLFGDEPSFLL